MAIQGRFKARAIEGALGMTGTGKEQVAVLFAITQGEHAGTELTWYGFFTEATVQRTFESLRHMGWEGDDLTDLAGIDANEVTLVVEIEEDNEGRERSRVKWVNSAGGSLAMKERMDEGAARAFAQRMRGQAMASRQQQRGGAQAQSRPRDGGPRARASSGGRFDEPSPFDDDIQF